MNRPFTSVELQEIQSRLEDYHAVFYQFWNMATVRFDDRIPTACVQFCKYSKPVLMFNYEFWSGLTPDERHFVVCHECLHVILQHDRKPTGHITGTTKQLENIAQDITINEMIVDLFEFNREDFRDWQQYCWIDTCFENPLMVQRNRDFYYYLDLLIKEKNNKPHQTMDDHQSNGGTESTSGEQSTESHDKKIDQLVEELLGSLKPEELQKIIDTTDKPKKANTNPAGSGSSIASRVLEQKTRPPRLNITRFIRYMKSSHPHKKNTVIDSFASENQKYIDIPGVCIPGQHEVEKIKHDKFHIMLFMDVSGSCVQYIPNFEKIVQSFEAESQYFQLEIYTFDDVVRKLDIKNRQYGYGGGTSFSIINDTVKQFTLDNKKKPDGVFVITDGYGDTVHPVDPKRWIWIMTPGNTTHYIDKKSHSFQMVDIIYE